MQTIINMGKNWRYCPEKKVLETKYQSGKDFFKTDFFEGWKEGKVVFFSENVITYEICPELRIGELRTDYKDTPKFQVFEHIE